MSSANRGLLAVLFCLASAAAVADEGAGAMPPPCPGVAAWYQAHPEQKPGAAALRDSARVIAEPALQAALRERFDIDQRARKAWLAAPHQRGPARQVTAVDADNLAWLKTLVRTHGFPTAAQVGEGGVHATWLLVQHADADPDFQAEALVALAQRHARGELDGSDLARLTDRVLVAQHRPQRYGTRFDGSGWTSKHFALPEDAQALAAFDRQRAELGVMPLTDYACMMNRAVQAL